MAITKEFIDTFKGLIDQYSQTPNGSRWRGGDSNYATILETLRALQEILIVNHNENVLSEYSVISFLSISAGVLSEGNPNFATSNRQFLLECKSKKILVNQTIDGGLDIHAIPQFDLVQELQKAIRNLYKARDSEIKVSDRQIEQLTRENHALRQEIEALKKQERDQLAIAEQVSKLTKARALFSEINELFEAKATPSLSLIPVPPPLFPTPGPNGVKKPDINPPAQKENSEASSSLEVVAPLSRASTFPAVAVAAQRAESQNPAFFDQQLKEALKKRAQKKEMPADSEKKNALAL